MYSIWNSYNHAFLTDLCLDIGISIEKYGVPQVQSQYYENMNLWDLALVLTFNCPWKLCLWSAH